MKVNANAYIRAEYMAENINIKAYIWAEHG